MRPTHGSGGLISSEAMEDDGEDDGEDEEAEGFDQEKTSSTNVKPEEHTVVIHGYSFKPERRRTTHDKREDYALAV